MFAAEYSHSRSYFHFEVAEELPEEGILKGKEGELKFKRIQDCKFRTNGVVISLRAA